MSAWDPMTPNEFKMAMKLLGIDKSNYERVFLSHERTIRRWISGSCPVPGPVAAFLRFSIRGSTLSNVTKALSNHELTQ